MAQMLIHLSDDTGRFVQAVIDRLALRLQIFIQRSPIGLQFILHYFLRFLIHLKKLGHIGQSLIIFPIGFNLPKSILQKPKQALQNRPQL